MRRDTVRNFNRWAKEHTQPHDNLLMNDFLYDLVASDCCPSPPTFIALKKHLQRGHHDLTPARWEGAKLAWMEYQKYMVEACGSWETNGDRVLLVAQK